MRCDYFKASDTTLLMISRRPRFLIYLKPVLRRRRLAPPPWTLYPPVNANTIPSIRWSPPPSPKTKVLRTVAIFFYSSTCPLTQHWPHLSINPSLSHICVAVVSCILFQRFMLIHWHKRKKKNITPSTIHIMHDLYLKRAVCTVLLWINDNWSWVINIKSTFLNMTKKLGFIDDI